MHLDFEIAGLHLRIASESRRLLDRVADRFQSYEAEGSGALAAVVELEDRGEGWRSTRPYAAAYPEAEMRYEAGRYEFWREDFEGSVTLGEALAGRFGVASGRNSFETPSRLVTALSGAHRRTLLLHAAGAVFEKKALLFTAQSGGGKTTLLTLLEAPAPLSDEIVAVSMAGDRPTAHSTPFTGGPSPARRVSGLLAGICFIHKGGADRLSPADRRSAFRRILRNTLAYVGDSETAGDLLGTAEALIQATGLFELEFRKSRDIRNYLADFAAGLP